MSLFLIVTVLRYVIVPQKLVHSGFSLRSFKSSNSLLITLPSIWCASTDQVPVNIFASPFGFFTGLYSGPFLFVSKTSNFKSAGPISNATLPEAGSFHRSPFSAFHSQACFPEGRVDDGVIVNSYDSLGFELMKTNMSTSRAWYLTCVMNLFG